MYFTCADKHGILTVPSKVYLAAQYAAVAAARHGSADGSGALGAPAPAAATGKKAKKAKAKTNPKPKRGSGSGFRKLEISGPTNFQHTAHLGAGDSTGLEMMSQGMTNIVI